MATGGKPIKNTLYEKVICPCCNKEVYVRYQRNPNPRILGLVDTDGSMTSTRNDTDITAVYEFWNQQGVIVHRRMTPDMAKAIKSELRNYTDTEIMQTIKNYAEIQKGEQYWFDYAWTLRDFLKRGLPKFLDMEVAKRNYAKRDIQPKTQPIHKCCVECDYKASTSNTHCPKCGGKLERDYTAGKYSHLVQR